MGSQKSHMPICAGTNPSPIKLVTPVNKFDYVTRLLTAHEQQLTQNAIQLQELTRRQAEQDQKHYAFEGLIGQLRDKPHLLDSVEVLRKDVDTLNKRADQLVDDRSQDTRSLQLGILQTEVERLREQVTSLTHANQALSARLEAGMDTASLKAELQTELMAALDDRIKAASAELLLEVGAVRSESSAAAQSAEAASLTVNTLALKLRTHIQACVTVNNSLTARTDSLSSSIDGLSSNVEYLENDSKKVKKHVVKLERQVEALSALGSVAVGADKAVGEMRRAADEAHENARRLRTQTEACMEEVRAVASRLAEAAATSSQADATLRADLTSLAEAVGAALGQVTDATRRAVQAQAVAQAQAQAHPPSLLQTLLAPGPGPTTSMPSLMAARLAMHGGYAPLFSAAAPPPPSQPQPQPGIQGVGSEPAASDVLDAAKSEYSRFLAGFRARSAAAGPTKTSGGSRDGREGRQGSGRHRSHAANHGNAAGT